NKLPLKWNLKGDYENANLVATPANFELEWLYLDRYKVSDVGAVSNKSISELDFEFRFNSTRVILVTNYFEIPLVYQEGYLVYRVRMVRPDSSLYKTPIYSPWTLPAAANLGSPHFTAGRHYYFISNSHKNDSLNWQYTISFAEEGKYKH